MLRYLSILLFFLALALVFIAVSYLVPGATVTLSPEVQPISVTQEILVDPFIETVDYGRFAVPGRILQVDQSWQTDVETTGILEAPSASARGKVVFANRLAEEVVVPAGVRVSTSEGSNVVFQTLAEAIVPGVEGGTAEVDVIAIEPGPQGNVAANLINKIEGSLAVKLDVRNLEPTEGGGVRETPAVTEADQERLRSQVLQFLQAASVSEMEAQLTEREFLARDSLRVVTIDSETFSHFPGEQANRVALEMRAQVAGTAVNTTDASGIVYEALAAQVPEGHILVPESIKFASGSVIGVDEAGRVTF
ncbi:MAG: baseplate J/gp47 family protein [Chloroflexi bacterium]|nr:baseplate J/gp47 family protein [Chloroflexota bacterium]